MSLESSGSNFVVHVALNEKQQNCLVPHIVKEPLKAKVIIESCVKNPLLTKEAFIEAMAAFAHTPEFQALTYNLENDFNIQVKHTINLSMPG